MAPFHGNGPSGAQWQTQERAKSDIRVLRQVASVEGNTLKLSIPLTDSFDAQFYPGIQPRVIRKEITGRIAENRNRESADRDRTRIRTW
jgi:hypothetical protein